MGACFDGFGNGLARIYQNASKVYDICREVNPKYRKSCFDGISGGLGNILCNNITRAINQCNELDADLRKRCYDGLGHGLGSQYSNTTKIYEKCNETTGKYKYYCFKGVGFVQGIKYNNVSQGILICHELKNQSNICLEGLGDSIGEFFSYKNISRAESECLKFENEEHEMNCIEEIGFGIGRNFAHNITKSVEMCKEMKNEFELQCLEGVKKTLRRKYGSGDDFYNRCLKLNRYHSNITC
ncbi:MAG: hypothetical protein ABEK36_01080 [Candidatus Aenigmatarchaeota archaeon]